LGANSKETSSLLWQAMESLRGGSSSVIRLFIRFSSEKPGGRSGFRTMQLTARSISAAE
jgi:hypothetical protein